MLHVIVVFLLFGSSTGLEVAEICYGQAYKLPFRYTPPVFKGKLYFTKNGGSPKLLMENGEARDPRIKVSISRVTFTDMKENDGGRFSMAFGNTDEGLEVIILKILPCAELVELYYGFDWYRDAPEKCELLDFTPDDDMDHLVVLWNRTNPLSPGGRGKMKRNIWVMLDVTQSDNGFYNFRAQDGTVLERKHLSVRGFEKHHHVKENDQLFIDLPVNNYPWTVTFTSKKHDYTITVIKEGDLFHEDQGRLSDRISLLDDAIEIAPVEVGDVGTIKLIDLQGNVAKTVWVELDEYLPTYVYVCIAVGIILAVILCCCCVRKRCCKKSSTKREGSAPQTAAAPAVYYHDVNQPAVFYSAPTNSSHQPNVSPAPATTSSGPSVVAAGGQGVTPAPPAGSDSLSADPGPRFELKGMSFPSAPPLGSDTSHLSDVYNSDKLNFL